MLCGGERPDGPGWYYPPTVLSGIHRDMRIHREEAFGPVATLYRAADLDEAVLIANDTLFGLSSNVWTRDENEVERFARDLEAGAVYVNGMTASHPAFPFGGVKRSGYGRELVRARNPGVLQHHHGLAGCVTAARLPSRSVNREVTLPLIVDDRGTLQVSAADVSKLLRTVGARWLHLVEAGSGGWTRTRSPR